MPLSGRFSGRGETFVGLFQPQGYSLHLTGTFIPPLPLFDVPIATIQYNDLEDFAGTYYVTPPSFVGEAQLNLKLVRAGGVELNITGALDRALLTKVPISGTAQWFMA